MRYEQRYQRAQDASYRGGGLFRLYLGGNSNAHVESEAWDQVSRLRRCRAVQPDNLELLGVGLLDAQAVALPCRRA
jgi:hypothetical protein